MHPVWPKRAETVDRTIAECCQQEGDMRGGATFGSGDLPLLYYPSSLRVHFVFRRRMGVPRRRRRRRRRARWSGAANILYGMVRSRMRTRIKRGPPLHDDVVHVHFCSSRLAFAPLKDNPSDQSARMCTTPSRYVNLLGCLPTYSAYPMLCASIRSANLAVGDSIIWQAGRQPSFF